MRTAENYQRAGSGQPQNAQGGAGRPADTASHFPAASATEMGMITPRRRVKRWPP